MKQPHNQEIICMMLIQPLLNKNNLLRYLIKIYKDAKLFDTIS
jgi:hypothetical protein